MKPYVLKELEPDEIRVVADYESRRMQRANESADQQNTTVSAWLTASLFAISGGGALATVSAYEKLDYPLIPVTLFGTALIATMLNAALVQLSHQSVSPVSDDLEEIWREAKQTGKVDEMEVDTHRNLIARKQKWNWVIPLFGWAAGILFVVGSCFLAVDLANPPAKHAAICKKLQGRMLMPVSNASDARELFGTLKCEWQE